MARAPRNLAASVRQRLLNISREQGKVFDVVLVLYGLERLLYRISVSEHRNRFVLKGGMLVTVWTEDENRVTRDADFLSFGELDEDSLRTVFTEVFRVEVEDGLRFDEESIEIAPIRDGQEYGGVRLKANALLDSARIRITVDIGVGDDLADPTQTIDYPSLLDMPSANLRAYPPASVIAEKFQAIVSLGMVNGRMKDYYDLWSIPNALSIEESDLDAAIKATFERRETAVPEAVPVGLSAAFVEDAQKQQQWAAYTASIELEGLSLEEIVESIWAYLAPACERLT